MSTLLLLRHGQAAAYEPDSDRLTELGMEQAARVGQHLLAEGVALDEAVSGTLERQRHTLSIVRDVFLEAGKPFPAPREDARWNEYDAAGVLGRLLPVLASKDAAFRDLVAAFEQNMASGDRNRHFQRMFELLMDRWRTGDVAAEGVEPFEDFHGRASAVFGEVTARSGRITTLVVSSGGPIGVAVQSTLSAPVEAALRVNWRVRNASLTEMVYSRGRVSLESFNVVAHFEPRLRTFR